MQLRSEKKILAKNYFSVGRCLSGFWSRTDGYTTKNLFLLPMHKLEIHTHDYTSKIDKITTHLYTNLK